MLSLFFILMLVTAGAILRTMTSMLRRIDQEEQELMQSARIRTSFTLGNIHSDAHMDKQAGTHAAMPSVFHEVGRTRSGSNTIPLRRPVDLYKPHVRPSRSESGSDRSA